MIRKPVLAHFAMFVTTAASEPEFTAAQTSSYEIEPSADLRKIELFDFWSSQTGRMTDGRCMALVSSAAKSRLTEVDVEQCTYIKRYEHGFPSTPCAPGQEQRLGGWNVTCRNLPNGRYGLVAEAAESTGVEARVELATGSGEALHFGIFDLHDRQFVRVLSVSEDGSASITEYLWSAGDAARYFSKRARTTPRS